MKAPLIRISKRDGISGFKSLMIRVIAVVIALMICVLLTFAFTGRNPIEVLSQMIDGSFMTSKRRWEFLQRTMILTCIAVGLAPAFKMRFWNVGAEGQMLMGGLAAVILMKFCYQLPSLLLLVLMALLAIVFGAIWGMIPGFFKAKWNANETLFTLMMNYIATKLVLYFCTIWEGTIGTVKIGTINADSKIPEAYHKGWIGEMFTGNFNDKDYMWVVVIVAAVVILMWAYLRYTKQGFEIAVVGDSENTAKYAGIRVKHVYVRTMAISGAVCGFAGFLAVSAVSRTLTESTADGRGFTAIIVAWLSHTNPFLMVVFSAIYCFMEQAGKQMASVFQLNDYFSKILTGIVLFFILGCEFFTNYYVRFRHSKKEVSKK